MLFKNSNFHTFSRHLAILCTNLGLKWYFSQKPTVSAHGGYFLNDLLFSPVICMYDTCSPFAPLRLGGMLKKY